MLKKRLSRIPIGVLFIASFYVFGAFVLLIGLFTDPAAVSRTIARAHGFLSVMGIEIVLVVAVLALLLAYGLVRLSRWGFILTMIYSMYMVLISLISASWVFPWSIRPEDRPYYGNFIFSVLVIVCLLIARRHFFGARIRNQRV